MWVSDQNFNSRHVNLSALFVLPLLAPLHDKKSKQALSHLSAVMRQNFSLIQGNFKKRERGLWVTELQVNTVRPWVQRCSASVFTSSILHFKMGISVPELLLIFCMCVKRRVPPPFTVLHLAVIFVVCMRFH